MINILSVTESHVADKEGHVYHLEGGRRLWIAGKRKTEKEIAGEIEKLNTIEKEVDEYDSL